MSRISCGSYYFAKSFHTNYQLNLIKTTKQLLKIQHRQSIVKIFANKFANKPHKNPQKQALFRPKIAHKKNPKTTIYRGLGLLVEIMGFEPMTS